MGVGWSSIDKNISFTKICMKYPDLYAKVMFPKPYSIRGEVQLSSNLFCYGLSEMSKSAQKTHIWQPPNNEGLGIVH